MLAGKKSQADKNLQDLFREFSGSIKETLSKDGLVNSAKSSLGGMSELLEKRRMRIKQMKEANREAKGEGQSEATD